MKDFRFAKLVVFVNSLVPLAVLAWDALEHQLGANPIEFAIRTTGMLTLIFLMLTLCLTPVRKLTGWNWLSHFRRMLGLYAFFYCLIHFSIYLGFYESFSLGGVIADTARRPFILLGMTGFILLIPLAITSTTAMIKRLGARRWKRLHQLIYLAAVAGVFHYWWLVKADTRQPRAFAALLALLLGFRILNASAPRPTLTKTT